MFGRMQDQPLLISSLIVHAERHHGKTEVVSRRVDGELFRSSWAETASNARRLAKALTRMGLKASDRIGTLAWNGDRHLVLYYGVSGAAMILHTINPRLHPDQLAWMINDAQDQVIFFDTTFLGLIQKIADQCPGVQHWVSLSDPGSLGQVSPAAAAFPPAQGRKVGGADPLLFDALLEAESDSYDWQEFDERMASSLCYTSGTTGNPKGALFSHRSTLLHAYGASLPDSLGLSARDSVMPVVPMFHVNAWGMPYSTAAVGSKLVLPGSFLDGASLYSLIEEEGVTLSAGVPTVWQSVLQHIGSEKKAFSTFKRVVIGGSACPPAMIRQFADIYGVTVLHAWGMTEVSPLGLFSSLKHSQNNWSDVEKTETQVKQGRVIFGIDVKIVDDEGQELAWDGQSSGHLLVRGPWVIDRYFGMPPESSLLQKDDRGRGWFVTGDVATIDPEGFVLITDRSKDVIKSGGEWISSITLENIAMAHPAIAMAACVGRPDPKWDERPVILAVIKKDSNVSKEALLTFYEGKVPKWQIPDDVVFVDTIPLGPTGKMQKMELRGTISATANVAGT
jgi:fatty-acyl-CoA synthase